MPVDATQVTALFVYGYPGPPQSFSPKPEAAAVVAYEEKAKLGYHEATGLSGGPTLGGH
ncbi:hypothetical protein LCGC14_2452030 [marine sediment metagenome]|uniref:Uncharacterized protein n=1 Tax=marine sediment metagenome TaxID=412755 RepID=A0A0F9BGA3_9ZZZZ